MKKLINRIFKLPPIGERKMIGGKFKEWTYPKYQEDLDDTYIYYQIIIAGIVYSLIVAALMFLSYFLNMSFDLYFFVIDVPDTSMANYSAMIFSRHAAPVFMKIFFPFFFIKFLYNVNLKTCDLLEYDKTPRERWARRKRVNIILGSIIGNSILLFSVWAGYYLPKAIINYAPTLENKVSFFILITLTLIPIIFGLLSYIFHFFMVVFQQIFYVKNANGRL